MNNPSIAIHHTTQSGWVGTILFAEQKTKKQKTTADEAMRIVVIDLKETLSAGVFLQNKKKTHTQKSENLKGNTPTHIGLQRGNIRGKHCSTKVYFDQGYLLLLVSFVRHYYSFFVKQIFG